MLSSLRARMGVLFLAFFGLLSISVAATFWAVDAQKQDALVINLAGRQRMLVQQMIKDALRIEHNEGEEPGADLQKAADAFEQTLMALRNGGQTPYLSGQTVFVPASPEPEILAGLGQAWETWTSFRSHLDQVVHADPASAEFQAAAQAVDRIAPELTRQADEIVGLYEAASARKLARLRWIQGTFLTGAMLLLALDFLLLHKLVVRPLQQLGSAAERIGGGDLSTPIEPAGPHEIERLAHSLDRMRVQLQAWTEELETRVAQRTRELATLHQVSREITSQLEIQQVLQSVTDKARVLLGGEVSVLCLLDEPGQILHSSASSGPAKALCSDRTSAQRGPAVRVLAGGEALLCGEDECDECCGILAARYRQSHLVAPLRIGERVIGALCVGGVTARQFRGEEGHILTELANSAAIALENARLYKRAERLAVLEERQRIAAEMHDGLAQTVSYLGLRVDQAVDLLAEGREETAAEHLQRLRTAIEQASAEVRKAIASLQQDSQPPQALQQRLARLIADLTPKDGPSVDLVAAPAEPLLLPHDVCTEVQRVVGEALLNAHRHARAGQIWVRLETQDGTASVMVEDDGQGFDLAASLEGSSHFGLSIMRARAARLGGRLAVDSRPGQGTRVTLIWPVEEG